jgi:Tol biopolymer transport system component
MLRLKARSPLGISGVLVVLALSFLAIPLALPSDDAKPPTVQFVYYRADRSPLAMDAPSRKNIYAVTIESTEVKQLTTDGHSFNPALSPDGSRIAYVHVTADTCEHCLVPPKYEINLMNADGTEPRTLGSVESPVTLAWSPDGRTVVYGGALPLDQLGPNWSDPDTLGKIYSAPHSLYSIDPDSDAPAHVLAEGTASPFAEPTWSPDGKWLAYRCRNPQTGNSADLHICLLKISDRSESKLFIDGPVRYSWSPNSAEIVYSVFATGGKKGREELYNVFVVRTDGSSPRLLTTSNDGHPPQWSPDGQKLIFCEREKNKSLIDTIHADGTGKLRLTDPKLKASNPLWSRDGSLIAFNAPIHDQLQAYLMNADGSQVRALTHNRKLSCENIRWLRNAHLLLLLCGQTVAPPGLQFARTIDGEYYVLSIDDRTGTPRRLAKQGPMTISKSR